ncbi:MAG: HDOD domain-containing protein [Vicinamibacterales bacterium]
MAANVVRLANSAFSASVTTITSLSDAVVRVGTRAVRQLVTASCLTSQLRNPRTYGSAAREMVDHSIGTAYLAWLVADRVDDDPDAAFLCGLLHDIGKFVILKLAHIDRPVPPAMTEARLTQCIQARHAQVGGRALARWQFADEIRVPVTWHHEPGQAHGHLPQAAIAYAANRLAHRYGFGCSADADPLLDDPTFGKLGLDERFLAELDVKAPGLFEVARKIAA